MFNVSTYAETILKLFKTKFAFLIYHDFELVRVMAIVVRVSDVAPGPWHYENGSESLTSVHATHVLDVAIVVSIDPK